MGQKLWWLAGLVLTVAIVLRSPPLGAAAFILGGSVVVTSWWLGKVQHGLRVRHVAPETLGLGDQAQVLIEVTNTSLLPVPWVQIIDSVPLALRTGAPFRMALPLGAGATRRTSYTIKGGRRGYYHLGPLRLATGDVLGLYQRQLTAKPVYITVFPQVLPVQDLRLPAQLPFGPLAAMQRRGEDPARPAGVRPYQSGDGVRRLDWKSTARVGDLLVRRAEPTIAPETTLALAFRLEDYPARVVKDSLERAVVTAASLGAALLARKLPVGLVTNGVDPKNAEAAVVLPQGKGDGHLQMLLTLLGRIEAGNRGPLDALLASRPLPWGGTLALITADLEPATLVPVNALRRRGQNVAVFLLEATPSGVALARSYHLRVYTVDQRGIPHAA